MDGWMNGWMDGWKDGYMDGWMDGWMGREIQKMDEKLEERARLRRLVPEVQKVAGQEGAVFLLIILQRTLQRHLANVVKFCY